MADAFYHRGLAIEVDYSIPRLTIDGRSVPQESLEGIFIPTTQTDEKTIELRQVAINFIENSSEFKHREIKRLYHLSELKKGVDSWNEWRKRNSDIRPLLYNTLYETDLNSIDLSIGDFSNANLIQSDFRCSDPEKRAKLCSANFHEANLGGANFSRANMSEANFCRTDLYETILSGAMLINANLQGSQLAKTVLDGAELTGCRVYGISAWDLRLEKADQKGLIIRYRNKNEKGETIGNKETQITVDNLEVAQFVYLLTNNKKIREVFDTITSKAVLILGRFTPERKEVLDLIRLELFNQNYAAIIFDFENTENQTLLETIMTLAGMVRFIIADVTSATMVREEIRSIVEKYPSKPIQPILLETEEEYVTLPQKKQSFKSVLETYRYKNKDDVISDLKEKIIAPAEKWLNKRTSPDSIEIELERKNKELEEMKKRIRELEEKFKHET